MSGAPTCPKCGEGHWKVFRCDGTHVRTPPQVDSPPVTWGASMEGFSTFGDESDNFEFLGGMTLMRKDA